MNGLGWVRVRQIAAHTMETGTDFISQNRHFDPTDGLAWTLHAVNQQTENCTHGGVGMAEQAYGWAVAGAFLSTMEEP